MSSTKNSSAEIKKRTIVIKKPTPSPEPIVDSGGEVVKYAFDYKEFNDRFIKLHGEDARCLKVDEANINSRFGTKIGYSSHFSQFLGKYIKGDKCKDCGHTFGKGQERGRHHFAPIRGKQVHSMCFRYKNEGLAEVNDSKRKSKTKTRASEPSHSEAYNMIKNAEFMTSRKFLKAQKTLEVCVTRINGASYDFDNASFLEVVKEAIDVVGDNDTLIYSGVSIGDVVGTDEIFDDSSTGQGVLSLKDIDRILSNIREALITNAEGRGQFIMRHYEAHGYHAEEEEEEEIDEPLPFEFDDFDPFA